VPEELLYRDFYYPLNVFMHILTHEEGSVDYLHYGLFESENESIGAAQERSTSLLLERLPATPARILEVGIGLATTLARLASLGYEAEGITPDEKQIAMVRRRHGDSLRVHVARFEAFETESTYDALVFQESSQYIAAGALFSKASALAPLVIVIDEFSLRPLDDPSALHALDQFLATAQRHGFALQEELDLSAMAAPTIEYFIGRIPRYRTALASDLGLTEQQADDLIESGRTYLQRYREGSYGYRLLRFERRRQSSPC
jgi:hypothetical protein